MNKDGKPDEDFLAILSQWNEIFTSEFKCSLNELLKESECDGKIPRVDRYNAHKIFYNLKGEDFIRLLHFSSEESELFCICKDWFQFWHNISGDKAELSWADLQEVQKVRKIAHISKYMQNLSYKTIRDFIGRKREDICDEPHKILFIYKSCTDKSVLIFDSNYNRTQKELEIKLLSEYPTEQKGASDTKKRSPDTLVQNGSYLEAFEKIDKMAGFDFSKNLFSFENKIYNESMCFGLEKCKADIDDFISRFELNQKE